MPVIKEVHPTDTLRILDTQITLFGYTQKNESKGWKTESNVATRPQQQGGRCGQSKDALEQSF